MENLPTTPVTINNSGTGVASLTVTAVSTPSVTNAVTTERNPATPSLGITWGEQVQSWLATQTTWAGFTNGTAVTNL